ncbi:acetyl/propionyl/methylcrotonyl-CoA carboxylase subunit alpha [Egicoccus halophilus]|uniref:Biotin-dependent 3-methylcrotonyl-coenzyme A carboxylase alpha1 subunit n=1 Tax=Egicoccus halophilus TaxID=1670830 RepID=A0A8J3A944_9ACTN|nr:biotin carboxylase N-terminal domain-containing protein [Egicoccus halophilus]GGI05118.1 acetyl/propionyl-CoA carboxylase subuit alpha [Egicoccus halophilus]
MLRRVLVANRGEIARRVIRTCHAMGIETVAVYSDADVDEPHVREATTAVRLGPAPAVSSYLDVDRLLAAARDTGADAVHPGYGFLSENAAFARAVTDAGLTFVGPAPDVLRLMGDKAAAKQHLEAAGVPVVPGIHDASLDDEALLAAADEVGFPLLVKAVAGGGGKGMRAVTDPSALPDALGAARREAKAGFGDDRVILERLVSRPRHVEVQVFGDRHGNVVHLLERECSVQRRHQKVVEEAPSPALDAALRERMGSAAVAAARSVSYEGAGTIEFLVAGDTLDRDEPEFFFLEMNTRLQVEHPVTELVTGLDLVELQLRVAAGEPLGFMQEQVRAEGHAVEVRLYAEDPVRQLPQTGPVLHLSVPDGEGVRADLGIASGSTVSRHYDPMLGKLIVHAADRTTACARLAEVLGDTEVHGVTTNLDLLRAIVTSDAFVAGDLTTAFLDEHLGDWTPSPTPTAALVAAADALADAPRPSPAGDPHRPWDRLGPLRLGGAGGWLVTLHDDLADASSSLRITGGPDGRRITDADGKPVPAPADGEVGGVTRHVVDDRTEVWVSGQGTTRRLTLVPATRSADPAELAGGAAFASPMPGSVIALPVAAGDEVAAGATLVVVEAMKMEHPVVAPADGTVVAVHVGVGDAVEAGAPLLAFEPTVGDGD